MCTTIIVQKSLNSNKFSDYRKQFE